MSDIVIFCVGALVGYLAVYPYYKGLKDQNNELLGTLYHRIGYTPKNHPKPDKKIIANEYPDLLALQEEARSAD